eukprot:TRINITY_DN6351_c0_g2_i1.p5 TRINITY_DN6351_c0_g2~~TRINITY_DN6351_c0_g2_i1.p5  ORF type:complete len:213 (+),score=30.29 TRINITY_DN6351_c0_g2_i1:2342-2980(+)
MQNRNAVVLAAVLAMTTTPLLAEEQKGASLGESNFSYSFVGGYLGRITPDEEINFLDEVYEDFGTAGLNGAVQLADNFAIGAGFGVFANEGNRTELTNSSLSLNLFFPIPIVERVDVIPQVGLVYNEAEACFDNICATEDDSALAYGVGARIWVVPGSFEFNAAFSDSDEDNSESTVSLGGALWFREHHSIELNVDRSDSFDAVTVGYRYSL